MIPTLEKIGQGILQQLIAQYVGATQMEKDNLQAMVQQLNARVTELTKEIESLKASHVGPDQQPAA